MTILVCGANGQLGLQFRHSFKGNTDFIFLGRKQLDLRSEKQIKACIDRYSVRTIINCAAYTNVQRGEFEDKITFEMNSNIVKVLSYACQQYGVRLIHISTDSVFDGTRMSGGYSEGDLTGPLNVYSKSKLSGEAAVESFAPSGSAIVRVSWLYSNFGNNFYEKIVQKLQLSEDIHVVMDQYSSPSFGGEFVKFLYVLVKAPTWSGIEIFHYGDAGLCSWYDFALEIAANFGYRNRVHPIETSEFKDVVMRPKYTKLATDKIENWFGWKPSDWQTNCQLCIAQRSIRGVTT